MKKIIILLAVTGIITTTSSTFISCNIKLIKQDLPTIEHIILDKTHTQADAKKSVQEKLADASVLTEKQIKDDKNLSYEFYNNDETQLSDNEKLYSSQKYKIKITANEDDQYFHKDSSIIEVDVKKFDFNLATAKLTIEDFALNPNCHTYLDLANKVFDKLAELSGLSNEELWEYSDNLKNDFCIIIDSNDYRLVMTDMTYPMHAQTFKITFNPSPDDQYFTGEANIDVNVEKFDLATADLTIEAFEANSSHHYLHLLNKLFDKISELSGLSRQDIWKHWDNLEKPDDFLTTTTPTGTVWAHGNYNASLTSGTYTITLIPLDNDEYFTGTKTIEIEVIVN